MDLQPPSVLAHLPHPLHASSGKTHIAEVYSLADSKKRKRHEVVVAVDGEAVNIYNIQTPKLVTSYALPPQSTFSCQPCSVRRKVPNHAAVKRQTYVAVKQQIKSFVEEHGGNGSSAPVISSSSYTVTDSDSPAVFLGIVPTESEEEGSFDVLAAHQDGRVRRLSSDLETQQWSLRHSEIAKTSATHEIRSCFLVEFEDAKKSLFKRRQDLAALAFGNLTESGVDEPSVLLLVSEPTGSTQTKLSDVKVQMFSVPANVSAQGRDESQKMRHLLTVTMPEVEGQETIERRDSQWYFHVGSAGLNLSFEKGYINFDLSQYAPTVTSKFILENEDFSSILRISPQSVIGAGQSMIAVYDTQYKSVQRSIPVDDVPAGGAGAKARTTFVSYFAKLGVAVAAKNNTLLAFDLSTSHTAAPSLKRPRDGLLIDAIGRGIGSSASQWDTASKKHRTDNITSLGFTSPKQAEQWNQVTAYLRKCAASKDADGFDHAVRGYFGKTLNSPDRFVHPERTLFLLSLIFSLQEDAASEDKLSASSSSRLSIELWPQQTCKWLIQIGHLSLSNIEIALRRSIKPRVLPSLPAGSLAQALVDSDPSLQRLIDVLQGRVLSSPDELAYILKLLINTARARSISLDEETPKALTNGEPTLTDPSTALTTTTTTPEASLANIFLALNTTLEKLHHHPLPATTTSIRSVLSRTEIISMVHHLRLSLATGGYTSRFTEPAPVPVPAEQTQPPLSLPTIISLLNASIDAIGPSGWISASAPGSTIDDSPIRDQELIADMKSEISAALAGVEEATYLKGILHEYLGYAHSVVRSFSATTSSVAVDASGSETPASALVRHEKLNGADLMIFGAPEEGDEGFDGDASGKLLPLSLKAASTDVSKTKIKLSTGEVKTRTSREIGYLRRKAAGKYSFERLIV
ncbi:hypothetical protein BO70DRAFT_365937 [Aspergillus heteromorphus CBS 117.55]|uniref:Utp8 beta-propeller domain-containing protein n=1 Tax=Aspergillus heteromorphus CBS 117.55 TaxID=1448321 RepID=A0A317VB24_9EURO|nr:uncharacterized protein BO70DRAFT_365937 [Aspergillus heteromorphus CBS 117.55]PWY69120.1 hypothetical protein BO70DRAFT_365937 [Aspergillus heteromorphus CBS 117.55]